MSDRAELTPIVTDHRTVWLTGLPAAGKTTIARATERLLRQLRVPCCVLDGDEVRQGLSSDLGLSRRDRGEQARRVACVAAMLAKSEIIPIVALVSPYAEDRRRAREIHETQGVGFLEVWVNTPVEVCARRDPKGLYAADAARAHDAHDDSGLTGISAPYESPVTCDLVLDGNAQPPNTAAKLIVERLASSDRRAPVA